MNLYLSLWALLGLALCIISCDDSSTDGQSTDELSTDEPSTDEEQSTDEQSDDTHAGKLLYWTNAFDHGIYVGTLDGMSKRRIGTGYFPDSVAIDKAERKMYYSNMIYLNADDASIQRADLDGSNVEDVVPRGWGLKTPKQLQLDHINRMVYFCDREGQRVYRAPMTGVHADQDLEVLVDFTDTPVDEHQFVGIALDIPKGQFYWTDRSAGEIRRASTSAGSRITPENVKALTTLIFENGLMPLDLYFDQTHRMLFFTDRGEEWALSSEPPGYIAKIDVDRLENGIAYVVKDLLKDPIGIAVDEEVGVLYFTTFDDGKVWKTSVNGSPVEYLYSTSIMNTGLAFVNWDSMKQLN